MKSERPFPVLRITFDQPSTPPSIPRELLEVPEVLERIESTHRQSLDELARRGGLSIGELAAHLSGRDPFVHCDAGDNLRTVRAALAKFEAAP